MKAVSLNVCNMTLKRYLMI